MRTAVSIPPFTDPERLVWLAVEAEQAGWTVPSLGTTWPGEGWFDELQATVRAGPPVRSGPG